MGYLFNRIFAGLNQAVYVEKVLPLLSAKHIFPLFFSLTILINSFVIFALSFVFAKKTVQRRRLILCGAISFVMGLSSFFQCELVRLASQPQGVGVSLAQCMADSALLFLLFIFLRFSFLEIPRIGRLMRLIDMGCLLSFCLMLTAPAIFLYSGYLFFSSAAMRLLLLLISAAALLGIGRYGEKRWTPLVHNLYLCLILYYLRGLFDLFLPDSSFVPLLIQLSISVLMFLDWVFFLRENYLRMEEGSQIREQLTQSQVQLMLSQIQPHFIYNALNSIHIMITKDPDVACSMITNFSSYLRSNMDAMGKNKLVPFEKELAHIRAYTEIEKIRFPKIDVVYEIDEDRFCLPVLTVEPLVENAIKHGVAKKRGGGTVTIRTYRNRQDIYIEVIDNGIGFDAEALEEDGGGIGIKNVKYRLEHMMNGSLAIDSRSEAGTVAKIRLPAEKAKEALHEDDFGR